MKRLFILLTAITLSCNSSQKPINETTAQAETFMQELTLAERARIEEEMTARLNDADEVLRHSCRMLALISHQTGMVDAPDDSEAKVNAIDLMPLNLSAGDVRHFQYWFRDIAAGGAEFDFSDACSVTWTP